MCAAAGHPGNPAPDVDPLDGMAKLAATPPEQEAAEIRAALAAVLDAWQTFRTDPTYPPRTAPDARQWAKREQLVTEVRAAAGELPAGAGPADVAALAGPLLGPYWPTWPALAARLSEAVETLRYLAAVRRPQIEQCRRMMRDEFRQPITRDADQ